MIASPERNQRDSLARKTERPLRCPPLASGCEQRDDGLIKLIKVRWGEKEKEQSNLTRRRLDEVSVGGRAQFLPSRLSDGSTVWRLQ